MDDIGGIVEALIWIIAFLGSLLIPVFKQIRDKRRREASGETPAPVPVAGVEPPMFEDRDPDDVPDVSIGLEQKRRESVADVVQSEVTARQIDEHHSALEDRVLETNIGSTGAPPPVPLAAPLAKLHSRPPAPKAPAAAVPSQGLMEMMRGRDSLRRAFVLKEILDRPIAMRDPGEGVAPGMK